MLVNARGSIMDRFRGFEEIKDTINEVKYECVQLFVEVFIKVMDAVMTLEEDKKFLCVCLLYYVSNFADSRMEVPRYRSSLTS